MTTPTDPLPELTILPLGNDLECVQVTGRLDPLGVQSIETKFMAHTAARRKPVIIDLSGVTYMNSLSIRLLMENAKALRLHKADLILFVPPGEVRHVLELTGVLNILKAGATLDEAKALLGTV